MYDTYTNATATIGTTGIKDITAVSTDTKLHLLTCGNIMPESNNIRVPQHQYATGDGIVYRSSVMGGIDGLVEGTTYYVYRENKDWFRLAASAANAVQKDAQGVDNPVTLPLNTTGHGYQRFENVSNLLSVATINTTICLLYTSPSPRDS